MSSTYHSLHYHIIFSTKHRREQIANTWKDRLHEYLGGTVRGLDGVSLGVGGVADHVHLLAGLKPTHRLSDFLRDLKKSTSARVHTEIILPTFQWQEGYAAFTVSPDAINGVRGYIARQPEHHKTMTFLEELTELLERAGIEFDPRYLN
jgi:putative transposase